MFQISLTNLATTDKIAEFGGVPSSIFFSNAIYRKYRKKSQVFNPDILFIDEKTNSKLALSICLVEYPNCSTPLGKSVKSGNQVYTVTDISFPEHIIYWLFAIMYGYLYTNTVNNSALKEVCEGCTKTFSEEH